jgi:hypothetical protein
MLLHAGEDRRQRLVTKGLGDFVRPGNFGGPYPNLLELSAQVTAGMAHDPHTAGRLQFRCRREEHPSYRTPLRRKGFRKGLGVDFDDDVARPGRGAPEGDATLVRVQNPREQRFPQRLRHCRHPARTPS